MNKLLDNKSLRILWLGGVFSAESLKANFAVNQAGNRWSRGFLGALQELGHEVHLIAHRPEQLWPKGILRPGNTEEFHPSFPNNGLVKYWNIPYFRNTSLKHSCAEKVREVMSRHEFDLVMCYNPYPHHLAAGRVALTEFDIPWVPVILDYDDPGEKWTEFKADLSQASAYIFLSYWGAKNCPVDKPILHMDAGCDQWYGDEGLVKMEPHTLLYSGKFNDRFGGMDLMAKVFAEISNPNCKIWLTGKALPAAIKKYFSGDPRITYHGFVSDQKLHELHLRAQVFFNPRPVEVSVNRMIFPSKLLNYLSYGKPVVSTKTPGIAPEYGEFLLYPGNENAKVLAAHIDQVFDWTKADHRSYARNLRDWLKTNKTWQAQASRVTDWLSQQVIA